MWLLQLHERNHEDVTHTALANLDEEAPELRGKKSLSRCLRRVSEEEEKLVVSTTLDMKLKVNVGYRTYLLAPYSIFFSFSESRN